MVGQIGTSIDSDYADNIITLLAGRFELMTRECLYASRKIELIKYLLFYHESIQDRHMVLPPSIEIDR